jgi:hypothetical protein
LERPLPDVPDVEPEALANVPLPTGQAPTAHQ